MSVSSVSTMFAYSGFDGAAGEINSWPNVLETTFTFDGNTAWTAWHEIVSGPDNGDGPPSRWWLKACKVNYYVQSNACAACPAGSTNPTGNNPNGMDTSCIGLCDQDYYVSSNACVACLTGAVRPAGDDATGPDTSCGCPENHHVCKMSYSMGLVFSALSPGS